MRRAADFHHLARQLHRDNRPITPSHLAIEVAHRPRALEFFKKFRPHRKIGPQAKLQGIAANCFGAGDSRGLQKRFVDLDEAAVLQLGNGHEHRAGSERGAELCRGFAQFTLALPQLGLGLVAFGDVERGRQHVRNAFDVRQLARREQRAMPAVLGADDQLHATHGSVFRHLPEEFAPLIRRDVEL